MSSDPSINVCARACVEWSSGVGGRESGGVITVVGDD